MLLCKFEDFFNNSRLYASPEQKKPRGLAEFPGKKLRKEKKFCGQAIVFVVVLFSGHSNLVV